MKNIIYLLLLISSISFAQSAPTYYNSIDFSLEGDQMKQQLGSLITSTHSYTVSYGELWDILKETDLYPSNNNKVMLIYGWDDNNAEDDDDLTRYKDYTCGNGNPCTDETWNREHVFPRGLDNSDSSNEGPTADPHMLRSSDVEMNSLRGSLMFGDGDGIPSYVTNEGYFYPGENWKGDVARIIMYMYVRYGEDWNPNYTGAGANSFHNDMPDIFLQWNAEDPVSEYEMNRNDYVNGYQGNRNPFIDNPYLATVIWGGPNADNTWPDELSTSNLIDLDVNLRVYPNPTNGNVFIDAAKTINKIEVYNVQGKLISSKESGSNVYITEKGVFIIKIYTDTHIYTKKVIRK